MSTFNNKRFLEIFSPSLLALDYSPLEFIVVDNGSVDGTDDWLSAHRPVWQVCRTPINLGTAGGWNLGAQAAHGEYLFLISDDLWFEPDAVSHMIQTFSDNPGIGVLGCKLKRITEDLKRLDLLDPMGNMLDLLGFPIPIGNDEVDRGQYDRRRSVFFVQLGALMIRSDLFHKVGCLDETMYSMSDDIDLCWRVRLRGFDVAVEPKATVWHLGTKSRGGGTTIRRNRRSTIRYLSERNTLRMLLKNWSLAMLLLVLPLYLLQWLCEVTLYGLLREWPFVGSLFKAIFFNIRKLTDTLHLRRTIQRNRKIRDYHLFPYVSMWPIKFHWGLRLLRKPHDPLWKGYFNG